MARWLRAILDLVEALGSLLRTHIMAYHHLHFSVVPGDLKPTSGLYSHCTYMAHNTNILAKH